MIHFTREMLELHTLGSGNVLSVPVFRFEGEPGKRAYIQANIHGPEIAGCGAIYELLGILQQQETLHGSVTLVPSINPVGLDTKIDGLQVGYKDLNDSGIANWNRIYTLLVDKTAPEEPLDEDNTHKVILEDFVAAHRESNEAEVTRAFQAALRAALDDVRAQRSRRGLKYSTRLALAAQSLALEHDYVIDLHTSSDATYHLYAFGNYPESIPYWGIPFMIELEDEFEGTLDEAFLLPWVRLQKAFEKAGREIPFAAFEREAFTLELGSADTLSRPAMQADAQRLINYLRYKGLLPGEAQPYPGEYVRSLHRDKISYYAPTGGFLLKEKRPGERVQTGDLLATVIRPYAYGLPNTPTEIPITAESDGVLISYCESHVVQEGMGVCSTLRKMKAL